MKDKDRLNSIVSEDALDGETVTLDEGLGTKCSICGQQSDADGSVYSCELEECPMDVLTHYDLDYNQELRFD